MTKQWVPTDYVDEVSPPGRDHPNDWLADVPGGGKGIANYWEDEPPCRTLKDGEEVKFDWIEHHGTALVTVSYDEDGGQDIRAIPDMPRDPPGGNMMVMSDDDPENCADDLATIASDWDAGEYDVRYYAWSWRSTPFVFRDGAFHELVATPAQE